MPSPVLHLGKLDLAVRRTLDAAAETGAERGLEVWLTGGLVRDALFGRESCDVDLVVVGESEPFVERLAGRLGGSPRRHEKLLTADFTTPESVRIDVARARAEVYDRPGALPTVRPGTLHEDLARRDFTVNAMAVPLGSDSPAILDPFGGRRALQSATLDVMHDRSFDDDVLRVLRGLRLTATHGLRPSDRCRELACRALGRGRLRTASPDRLRRELRRLLAVADEKALTAAAELGLDQALPSVTLDRAARRRFARLAAAGAEHEPGELFLARLLALAWRAPEDERDRLGRALGLGAATRRLLTGAPRQVARLGLTRQAVDSGDALSAARDDLPPLVRLLAGAFDAAEH